MSETNAELILNMYNFLNSFCSPIKNKFFIFTSRKIRAYYKELVNGTMDYDTMLKMNTAIEKSWFYRISYKYRNVIEDVKILISQRGKRRVIDKHLHSTKDYLSIACIVKNEGQYLKEYIEFYLMQGVERIYLFDNESEDNTWDVLKPYIENGKVVYIYFPGKKVQYSAYRFAIRYCKKNTRWLALLDADEFLFTPNGNLPDTMRQFESFPGVGVNWILFGPSGYEERPNGLVIESYVETFIDFQHVYNKRIKSIVNPKMVESCTSPHFCLYKNGEFAVDTEKNLIDGSACYISGYGFAFTHQHYRDKLRINHYITKSKAELRAKCKRGYPDGGENPNYQISLDRFNVPLVEDRTIQQYTSEIKKRIEKND